MMISDDVKRLSWVEFEKLLGQFMKERWSNTNVTPPGRDRGIDAISYQSDGKVVAVGQAKHMQSVGRPVVQQLVGAAVGHRARTAVLFTSGRLTQARQEVEEQNRINPHLRLETFEKDAVNRIRGELSKSKNLAQKAPTRPQPAHTPWQAHFARLLLKSATGKAGPQVERERS